MAVNVRYQYRGADLDPGASWFAAYLDGFMETRVPLVMARETRQMESLPAEEVLKRWAEIRRQETSLRDRAAWSASVAGQSAIGLEREQEQSRREEMKQSAESSRERFKGEVELSKQSREYDFQVQTSKSVTDDDRLAIDDATRQGLAMAEGPATPELAAAVVQKVAQNAETMLQGVSGNATHQGAVTAAVVQRAYDRLNIAQADPATQQAFGEAVARYITGPNGLVAGYSDDGQVLVSNTATYENVLKERAAQPAAPGAGSVSRPPVMGAGGATAAPAATGEAPAAGVAPSASTGGVPPAPATGGALTTGTAPATGGMVRFYQLPSGMTSPSAQAEGTTGSPIVEEGITELGADATWLRGLLQDTLDGPASERRKQVEIDLWTRAPDPKQQALTERLAALAQDPDKFREFQLLAGERQRQKSPAADERDPRWLTQAREAVLDPGENGEPINMQASTSAWAGDVQKAYAAFVSDAVASKMGTRNADGSVTLDSTAQAALDAKMAGWVKDAAKRGATVEGVRLATADLGLPASTTARLVSGVQKVIDVRDATKAAQFALENTDLADEVDATMGPLKAEGEREAKERAAAAVGPSDVPLLERRRKAALVNGNDAEAAALTERIEEADPSKWSADQADKDLEAAGVTKAFDAEEFNRRAAELLARKRAPAGPTVTTGLKGPSDAALPAAGGSVAMGTRRAPPVDFVGTHGRTTGSSMDAEAARLRGEFAKRGLTGDALDAAVSRSMTRYELSRKNAGATDAAVP